MTSPILTHVPYRHKVTSTLYRVTDVVGERVIYQPMTGASAVTHETTQGDFLIAFERVREAKMPKGWDEEL